MRQGVQSQKLSLWHLMVGILLRSIPALSADLSGSLKGKRNVSPIIVCSLGPWKRTFADSCGIFPPSTLFFFKSLPHFSWFFLLLLFHHHPHHHHPLNFFPNLFLMSSFSSSQKSTALFITKLPFFFDSVHQRPQSNRNPSFSFPLTLSHGLFH